MKPLVNSILTALFLICGCNVALSQSIPAATAKKIDSLFKQWDNTKSPGCAIGIVRNDSLIYAKGYGMANLETGTPLTTENIFELGSTSKQFTSFSIVLLARQGKLSLDDDIHKYLAWVPYFGEKITIRNLLTHTNGLRNIDQLLAIQGTRREDVITREHIINILSKQESLNFTPGTQYMYNNSGYFLAGEIIRAVTGKSLRQFTDSAIFKPLSMNYTHLHDDYTELVPGRASSYERKDATHFANSILVSAIPGATGIYSNVNDMSKWLASFYSHKLITPDDMAQLTQKTTLQNGKQLDYALGIEVEMYRGMTRYAHGGTNAGYFTYVMYLPDLKMSFIVFSNLRRFPMFSMAEQLADIFIKSPVAIEAETQPVKRNPDEANITDYQSVKPFLGSYISEDGDTLSVKFENKKLYCFNYGDKDLLIGAAKDTMVIFYHPDVKLTFEATTSTNATVQMIWRNHMGIHISTFKKYDAAHKPTDKELLAYTGTYYSPELDCRYEVILKTHHLKLISAKYGESPLNLYGKDHLTNDFTWMYNLTVVRNTKGRITGFEVNCGSIQDLLFNKVQ